MTVISATPDTAALTLTVVADLAASPERVWQIWADPRQLEQWWGPPTWPATFATHDFVVDGRSTYVMSGPDGERANGWWRFLAIDEPTSLEFEDGFADDDGAPSPEMPVTRAVVELIETATGTRMTITSYFSTLPQMEQLVAMGMMEGMREALGQIDEMLAA